MHRNDSSSLSPAAAAVGGVGSARGHASYSPGSFSKQLAASAVGAAAGRQSGMYGSLSGKQGSGGTSMGCWSPLRGRPVSAGALGAPTAVAGVGSPPGAAAAGQMSRVLKGELQALDSDIAAAEASLQAAAQRLGAGQPSRQW
jgi:hypothetical protein